MSCCVMCDTQQGVGDVGSIKCVACHRWVHKRCSGISGRLGYVADFCCRRCLDGDSGNVVLSSEVELQSGVQVECVSKPCYLGDTLGSGGGVVEAARARVRCAWAKFKELSPILTVSGASYRIKGRIYSACVQSVLIYGTETWAMRDWWPDKSGMNRAYDGEMDVWGVRARQKAQWGFMQPFWH